jgi:threonine synthase
LSEPNVVKLKNEMYAVSVTDSETRNTIKSVYQRHKIILEPHGSVGWTGLQKFYSENKAVDAENQLSVTLETAHPAKFPQEINEILGIDPALPKSLLNLDNKEEKMTKISNDFADFKAYLKSNF